MNALLGAALLGVVLTLGACGDDGSGASAGPSPGATTATSADQTTAPGPTPTGEASASPASGVAPATGPEMHVKVTSLRVPEGFAVTSDDYTGNDATARSEDGSITLLEIENAADVEDDLRVQAFLQSQPDGARTERLPDVTVGPDAQHALRFAWTFKGDDQRYESVLFYRGTTSVSIDFIIRPALDRRDPQAVESVLASVTWL